MAYTIKNNGLSILVKDKEVLGTDFLSVECKEFDDTTKSFWAVASTPDEDRDKDIIPIEEWNLKIYKDQPRGLWSHNYYELPVFRSEDTKIDKATNRLVFRPIFASHEKANIIYNLYRDKFLSAFSVGFIPKDFEWRDENQMWAGGRKFKDVELLEISAVNIPANPKATVMPDGMKSLISESNDLIKLGYATELHYDEKTGLYWVPISKNLEAFKDPRTVSLGKGIKAVSAVPLYDTNSKVQPAVGYYFDSADFKSTQDIFDWLSNNSISCSKTKKYYSFDVSKSIDDPETIKLVDEVVQDGFTDVPVVNSVSSEDAVENPTTETTSDPVKSFPFITFGWKTEDNSVIKSKTFEFNSEEIIKDFVLQLFDKTFTDSISVSINELVSQVSGLKAQMESLEKNFRNEEIPEKSSDDDEIISLSAEEFLPVSQPIEEEKFTINEEEFKEVINDSVKDVFNFNKLFDELMQNNSGKLD